MSNINVIGVIGALLIAGFFLMHHILQAFSRKNIEITMGVAQGVPIPLELRWRMIVAFQVPVTGFAGAFNLVIAFSFLAIGDNVDDAHVRLLAQACAWLFLCGAGLTLTLAPAALAANWKAAKSYPSGRPLADR
jgi:hypothetical protein